ncbi:hypothetical protein [uncultured Enterovirga sp.]|uniref:hypothetical protein n=1 Tax=uncultured Enterovirga sp. TaxID=2026352 RepID=UPI0035C99D9A
MTLASSHPSTFKRNQLDGALYALFSGPPRSVSERLDQPVPSAFRTRIKRLLELDRDLAPTVGTDFAFHDAAAPGKGNDVTYTDYRAFNVAVALELVRFGCKQLEVVEKVLELEPKLRKAFDQIAKTYTTRGRSSETTDKKDRKLYLIVSQIERPELDLMAASLIEVEIAEGVLDLQGRLDRLLPKVMFGAFVLEISELAARLTELLKALPPTRRGR